jgi:hypothetical protein
MFELMVDSMNTYDKVFPSVALCLLKRISRLLKRLYPLLSSNSGFQPWQVQVIKKITSLWVLADAPIRKINRKRYTSKQWSIEGIVGLVFGDTGRAGKLQVPKPYG